jgi:hypothetical protein
MVLRKTTGQEVSKLIKQVRTVTPSVIGVPAHLERRKHAECLLRLRELPLIEPLSFCVGTVHASVAPQPVLPLSLFSALLGSMPAE